MGNWKNESVGKYGVQGAKYGDLYKASYGVGSGCSYSGADMTLDSISNEKVGIGNLSGSYIPAYERKTNKEASYDDSLLKSTFKAFNNSSNFSQYVDLKYLAMEEAVSYFVGNPDSLRNNYNNYMLYFRRTDGKMVIIPIDNDRSWGITKDWGPRDGYKNVEIFDQYDVNYNENRNNLLKKTILSKSTETSKLYVEYLKLLLDSDWLKEETFNQYFDIAKKSYSKYNFSLTQDDNNILF